MKATGVVRRIDDLGRIVIPKELRRSLRIREGDSIEIFIDEASAIVLKKYSPMESIQTFITEYLECLYQATKKDILIIDTERVIGCCGGFKKEVIGRKIDLRLNDRIQKKGLQVYDKGEFVEICDGLVLSISSIIKPITVFGDVIGAIILVNNPITELDISLVEISASFIGKNLES